MKLAEFDALTKQIISPYLEEEMNFSVNDGIFYKNLESGVRHLAMFDFDVSKFKTFRVIIGFNANVIAGDRSPGEAGVFGARYLSRQGFSESPINMPCFSKEAAIKSLEEILKALKVSAVPWMEQHKTLESLLEVIENNYLYAKGKLLFSVARYDEAKEYLSRHLTNLLKQPKTDEVRKWIQDTQEMLKRCDKD